MRIRRRRLPPVVLIVMVPLVYAIGMVGFAAEGVLRFTLWFFTGIQARRYRHTSRWSRCYRGFVWFPLPCPDFQYIAWLSMETIEQVRVVYEDHYGWSNVHILNRSMDQITETTD